MSPFVVADDTGFLYISPAHSARSRLTRITVLASAVSDQLFDAEAAASAFIGARKNAGSMRAYPGPMPATLAGAYRCQDAAIRQWPDDIIGWKVGWIPLPLSEHLGEQRLLGPIFRTRLYRSNGIAPVNVAIFADGFAAVEAEFVFELARDAEPRSSWTPAQAADVVARMHIGIEIASSPLATINALGATAVISDFGNNAGLLLGPEVPDWRSRQPETLACETRIEGRTVGTGTAASVAGGPLAALAFALRYNESRGRLLRAGDYVTTGATTGIHDIRVGQRAEAVFAGVGSLRCIAAPMPALVR
jgi:2-keto-4-pentenoate hydratase